MSSPPISLEAQESDAPAGARTLWPLRTERGPGRIRRHILAVFAIITFSVFVVWYSMSTVMAPSQVPVFIPQAAVITIPGINITIPARPAAFGPMISDNLNVSMVGQEVVPRQRTLSARHSMAGDRLLSFLGSKMNSFDDDMMEDEDDWGLGEVNMGVVVGFTGPLKVVKSDGCKATEAVQDLKGSIALVERGDCSFYEKVMVLQEWGAVAVIVGDNVYRRSLVTMYTGEQAILI